MAWQPAIPQAGDFVSASQPLILGNFQALDVWSQVDHSVIDGGANDGKHLQVHLPNRVNGATTAAAECALFSGIGPISGLAELFFRPENQAAATPVANLKPWTEFRTYTLGGTDGYFYVAGGRLLVKFNIVVGASSPQTYNYTAGPAFVAGATPIVMAIASLGGGNGEIISITATTDVSFTYRARDPFGGALASSNIYFIALSRPA